MGQCGDTIGGKWSFVGKCGDYMVCNLQCGDVV